MPIELPWPASRSRQFPKHPVVARLVLAQRPLRVAHLVPRAHAHAHAHAHAPLAQSRVLHRQVRESRALHRQVRESRVLHRQVLVLVEKRTLAN